MKKIDIHILDEKKRSNVVKHQGSSFNAVVVSDLLHIENSLSPITLSKKNILKTKTIFALNKLA